MTDKHCPYALYRPPRRRRAFVATITAVTLIGLVGLSLTAIVAASAADARRTRRLGDEAQIRQLLQAGATDAAARAAAWGNVPAESSWELPLPARLTGQEFQVHTSVRSESESLAEVTIDATCPTVRQIETLRFTRDVVGWKLERPKTRGSNSVPIPGR